MGSAGALQDNVHLKDVIIPASAMTNSSCLEIYNPDGKLTASADPTLQRLAEITAKELGIPVDVGTVFTTDYFYNPDQDALKAAKAQGLLAVEMETAGLYLCAKANEKRALSLLSISDHVSTGEMLSPEEIREGFHDMMKIALITAVCSL